MRSHRHRGRRQRNLPMKHRNLNLQSRRKKNRDVLTDIYTVAPGTAGSSLRATCAAGELLDWIDVNSVEQEDVFRWIDENVPMEKLCGAGPGMGGGADGGGGPHAGR